MTYLQNTWYAAAWDHEVTGKFLARTLLDQPVMFYRDVFGKAVALADRCAHRFAPLSGGKLVDGVVECPYHGLRYGSDGICVHNPHGNIPKAAKVTAYPLLERYGMIWIWMGPAEDADPALLADFSALADERRDYVSGYLRLNCHYELATDNLLDLSHVQYLHPLIGNSDSSDRNVFALKVDGNTIWAYNTMPGEPLTKMWKMLWDGPADTLVDRRGHMRWDPPSNMLLDIGVTACGQPKDEGISIAFGHILTPESAHSTHYFWMAGRDCKRNDAALSEKLRIGFDATFRNEDDPMIMACQSRMGGVSDLMSLKPILLVTDAAAVRARRVLAGLIEKEKAVDPVVGFPGAG
ncbi:aromatic ring-hydroxylating dioxygenase subunit alpha [Glaciimonas sp. PAMC28666]|uniref:aromatic ring-hydroxylating dioxygenase subunit alpha n=1 Tax=Glaciimonas sp. PAMC28666 TaxID=2807626 RepID=UPI001962E236|nr:aromatic ring-hydroxylating dioxygenase subunit alpha [Glaciimonas sp. PAMC28666]QRX81727.1 aromatic ring-hydroxylating dioxygenase subunit alpha [Glaciimonas sp. PAMC28666]